MNTSRSSFTEISGRRTLAYSGNRREKRASLVEQMAPAHFEDSSKFAISIGLVGKRDVTVTSQRPVGLEEVGFGIVSRKDLPLLEQHLADLMMICQRGGSRYCIRLWQAAGVIRYAKVPLK